MSRGIMRRVLVVLLLLSATAGSVSAQSNWLSRTRNTFSLEVLRPFLKEGADDLNGLSAAFAVTGRFAISDRWDALVELPLAIGHVDAEPGFPSRPEATSQSLGNLYVGMSGTVSSADLDFGVRLPTVEDFGDDRRFPSRIVGIASMTERITAFSFPASISATAAASLNTARSVSLRPQGGVLILVPTENEGGDSELFGMFGLQGWYTPSTTRAGAGISGRYWLTGGGVNDRTLMESTFWLDHAFGNIRPGVYVVVPIDQDFAVSSVVGVSVQVGFGGGG